MVSSNPSYALLPPPSLPPFLNRSRARCWRLFSGLLSSNTDQVAWWVWHLRLRTAGDVEENPGPEVLDPCSVCGEKGRGRVALVPVLGLRAMVSQAMLGHQEWAWVPSTGAVELSLLQRPGPTIAPPPHTAARSRRIWRIPDRWYPPRLVPSFRRLRGPGGVGSQVLPRAHKARTTLAPMLHVLNSGEATSCSSTAMAFVTATQNCRTSCTKPCASRLSARD